MSYEFLEHTADVKFRIKALSLDEMFSLACIALNETIRGDIKILEQEEKSFGSTCPCGLMIGKSFTLSYNSEAIFLTEGSGLKNLYGFNVGIVKSPFLYRFAQN